MLFGTAWTVKVQSLKWWLLHPCYCIIGHKKFNFCCMICLILNSVQKVSYEWRPLKFSALSMYPIEIKERQAWHRHCERLKITRFIPLPGTLHLFIYFQIH